MFLRLTSVVSVGGLMALQAGMKLSRKYVVTEQHTAKHLGSGGVEVLATPSMILFMEETCRILADENLPQNLTTVGTHVNVYHVKAAPVGAEVEVKATLLNVDERRLTYWVEVLWEDKLIGYGTHERFVVDKEKFLNKLKR